VKALFVLVWIALLVYGLIDCVRTPEDESPVMPRAVWFLFIILVPIVGPIAWLVLTRPSSDGNRPGPGQIPRPRPQRAPRGPLGPDDDPDFLRKL
jgi:hypothetical protein